MARRTDKSLPRAKKVFTGSQREFIEDIAKATEPLEKTFETAGIGADEDVAQVCFDYNFKTSSYRENWENEL